MPPPLLALVFLAWGIPDPCNFQPAAPPARSRYEILRSGTSLGFGFSRRWFVVRVSSAHISRLELTTILDRIHARYGRPGSSTVIEFRDGSRRDDPDNATGEAEMGKAFALGVVRADGTGRDVRIRGDLGVRQ
jgi:hypothetical protein